ncbi:MAG TPA: ABC transporter substrate-binding protein [Xanthobacteraceae bacterium]|nr:ABC transporter substrate-binding protein [Xanthobacteraceae bacterium]
MFRLVVADLDSPSYFVATAAAELGFFKAEGVDIELERAYGALNGPARLRAGEVHFLGGPAYMAARAFPGWQGVRLLCALSQYSYWFLAVRADLDVRRGDLAALKGLRISSSTAFPELGLRHLLGQAGIDLTRDGVSIVPMPASKNEHFKYRVGVEALEQNIADAYWGNGMRLALGEKLGVAKPHLDLRRGDGPPGARFYNFAALTTTERLIEEQPNVAAGAVRAIVKAQAALKTDPSLATAIGERLFAPEAAALIAGLIARDAPFYDATIAAEAVDGINKFALANGLLKEPLPYERLVASEFRDLWSR